MAVYGISEQGVQSLRKLAEDMSHLNDDIQENGEKLEKDINGLGNSLGIYEEEILELVGRVNRTQETGRESVEQLAAKINKLAEEVEALVGAGL